MLDRKPIAAAPSIVWDTGVHIENTLLWFDPRRPRDFAIVSSARLHIGDRQRKLLVSDRTAKLVSAAAGHKVPGLITPFGRPVSLGPLRIELFPSGYLAGAASSLVTLPNGFRVVYSGPFSPIQNRTAESMETRKADLLILDATYGNPKYQFQPRSTAEAEFSSWIRATLDEDCTPVVLVSCPGKAQDIMHLVGDLGLPICTHRTIHTWSRAYRELGVNIPIWTQFRGHTTTGEVLLWPAHLRRSTAIRNLRRLRFAAATGTSLDPGAEKRLKVNRVFPWSGRADFPALLDYAKKTGAHSIVTVGRYANDLAEALSAAGFAARALRESPQLNLL